MINAMFISFDLPQNLWGEAILSTNYILNKLSKTKTNKTSYELWKGSIPSYKFLKVWQCNDPRKSASHICAIPQKD